MVDFTIDVFHGLHPDEEPPEALHEKRSDVVRQLTELQEKSSQVIEMFSRKDVSCSILLKYSSSNLRRTLLSCDIPLRKILHSGI